MSLELDPENDTEWLRSPLQEQSLLLQPMSELQVRPYFGTRRNVQVFQTHLILGRHQDCDITLDDPFVSPRHAELRFTDGGYFVRDLGSRNGVFLNGVRVGAAPLPRQGTLRLGRSTITWSDAASGVSAEDVGRGFTVADPSMRALMQSLKRVAPSNLPVLLLGETGTGKDVLAGLLHEWGPHAGGPYVPVNGALTGGSLAESELFGHRKGAFTGAEGARLGALRSAHGGTLFLDEVADIPPHAQVKLLRALESGEVKALGADSPERVQFRLVCATSRDLERRVQDGEFRLDLYYRIAGFVVHIPPLRERPLDVLAIARRHAATHDLEIDPEAEGALLSNRWPGNVRELRASVERAAVAAKAAGHPRILAAHLGALETIVSPADPYPRPLTLLEQERRSLQAALERNGWSRVAAARELGIARSSLHGKMRRFGIRDQGGGGAQSPSY